jgi:hypothetical protein
MCLPPSGVQWRRNKKSKNGVGVGVWVGVGYHIISNYDNEIYFICTEPLVGQVNRIQNFP